MVVLYFGDIFGRPGRQAVARALPHLRDRYAPNIVLGNVENLAGGRGVTEKTLGEMVELGFHGFSSGNHIWDNKEIFSILDHEERLIRPANYPDFRGMTCPGRGYTVVRNGDHALFLINLMGRVFMDPVDCPFQTVDKILNENKMDCPILVDMHCETTSEKYAMGWFLNGRVAAVLGTHTHVQTADERILPGKTAYITDVGMTGAFNSVIGVDYQDVIKKFLTKLPFRPRAAKENLGVSCVVIRIGRDRFAYSIERVIYTIENESSGAL